jgi:hypothetical protein
MVPRKKPGSLWFIEDYILTKRYGQCHASSLPLFTRCNQASSFPSFRMSLIVFTARIKIVLRGCRHGTNFAEGQHPGCGVWNAVGPN